METFINAKNISKVAIDNKNKIIGFLPLFSKSGPYGDVINSLPFFGSNGGIISKTKQAEDILLDYFNNLSNNKKVACTVWISNPFDQQVIPDYNYKDFRIAQYTRLDDFGINDLPKLIHSSAKRNLKKALKEDIKIFKDKTELNFLENVHKENILSIGGKTKPKEFFESLRREIIPDKKWNLYVAKKDNKLLAALLTFEFAKTVEYIMPVVSHESRSLQPSSAIIYFAMHDTRKRGFKIWNWGGTWASQEGVYKFKKKWGAIENKYFYYIKLNKKELLYKSKENLSNYYNFFYTLPYELLK